MKKLKSLLSVLSVLTFAACSQAGLFIANLPQAKKTIIYNDISFGPADWQKMDIYVPDHAENEILDVVVFIHGGRWTTGNKNDYKFVGTALSSRHFITVIPDFRKYPDVKFPVFAEDAAQAVSWTMEHIQGYGGDIKKIHLAGHSSGAHVAALLATDSHYLKALGKDRSAIRSFAGLSGPYAFIPDEPDLIDMFGPPENYARMQVTSFINGQQPPMFLLYGGRDTLVEQSNMDKLAQKIHEKGGCVKTKIYPDLDHIWTIGALSWLGKNKAPVLDDLESYFKNSDDPDFCKR